MWTHSFGAETMLDAICGAGSFVIPAPESRIDFDNSVLRTLDPFLLTFTRNSFLGTLENMCIWVTCFDTFYLRTVCKVNCFELQDRFLSGQLKPGFVQAVLQWLEIERTSFKSKTYFKECPLYVLIGTPSFFYLMNDVRNTKLKCVILV